MNSFYPARKMIKVEACIQADTNENIQQNISAAYAGGAATVELCAEMAADGLTPEASHIRTARTAFRGRPGLMVMIRPRKGDFQYSFREISEMHTQIQMAADAGADGVVFGVLQNNEIDLKALAQLCAICRASNLRTTFHRAFDAIAQPMNALEILVDNGIDRILTSGIPWQQPGTALDGRSQLERLIRKADKRLEIVIGGGVNSGNVKQILKNISITENVVSVHAYSGIQENGMVTIYAVKTLLEAANK